MIRALTATDVDQFIAMRRESFTRAPLSFAQDPDVEIDRAQTIRDLEAKHSEDFILGYFVHADDDTTEAPTLLVGILGLFRYEPAKRRHRSFLWGVYVKDEFQGRSIARQLVKEGIALARKMEGLTRIILTASHHAEAAIQLYRSEGFVVFGREPGASLNHGVPMDEVYMLLDLPS